MLEGAFNVERSAVGAGDQPGFGYVDHDPDQGRDQHQPAGDLGRVEEPLDRLVDEPGGQILFLSLSLAAELTDTGLSKARSALVCTGLGLITAVGAIGGAALLGGAGKPVLAAVLAFGAAALLYLALEELLVEAHEQAETTLSAAMFFAGFLSIYVLGQLGG